MNGKGSVLGIFGSARLLVEAIPAIRNKVAGRLEAYTPFPIHGIDQALGLRKSPVGGMVFLMGVVGALSGLLFEMWANGIDYPLVTAGKPYLSWEAFVPIMFEMTVLFACFTSGLGMLLLLNRLPLFRDPVLRSSAMAHFTRDKFGLAVECDLGGPDAGKIAALLRDSGAESVERIEAAGPRGPASAEFMGLLASGLVVVCALAGILTYWGTKLFPVSVPMVHMLSQPRLDPERSDPFFKDGFGMRPPVAATVMRGSVPYLIATEEEAAVLENPLPRTERVLRRGRQLFTDHCAVCHGLLGNGAGSLTAAYGAKPANLVAQKIIALPDGEIHHVIRMGKNAMPSYAADLDDDERWAAVDYVRVLQRALNAKNEDIAR
jgi:mono/diheme cytochrome c family protein